MAIRGLGHRVERIRQARATARPMGRIVIICPDDWPEQDQLAYEAAQAGRDWRTQADIVERMTGERPVFPTSGWRPGMRPAVIEVRTRPDGPH